MTTKPDSSQITHNGVPLDEVLDNITSPSASTVTVTPVGNLAANNAQAALAELDAEKQAQLASGVNIKTINGNSILGSGNLTVSGGGAGQFLSVATYGATGDGSDETADFQAAYDECPAGGTILVPGPVTSYNVGTLTGTKKVHWLVDFDPSDTPALFYLPGVVEATADSANILFRDGAPSDLAVARVDRHARYTGGTNGFVSTALRTTTTANAGTKNFEWNFLSQLINNCVTADGTENVATYAQAVKKASGTTWAACFEIRDENPSATAVGVSIGLEISAVSTVTSTDPSFQRHGINVAGIGQGSGISEWGRGFWTSANSKMRFREAFSNTAPYTKAAFFNSGAGYAGAGETPAFIRDVGSATYGLDLSGAGYSTGVAIRLGEGQKIELTPGAGGAYLNYASGRFQLVGSGLYLGGMLQFPGSVVSGSASAAPGGAATPATTAGFLSVLIDGSPYKIPLYGA